MTDDRGEGWWFKVHKASINHELFYAHNGNAFRVYIFMCARIRSEPGYQGGVFVPAGKVYASLRYIESGCKIKHATAQRCIRFLKIHKLIRQVPNASDGVYSVYAPKDSVFDTKADPQPETEHDTETDTNNRTIDRKNDRSNKPKRRRRRVEYCNNYEELWKLWKRPGDDKQRGAKAYYEYLDRSGMDHAHVMLWARSYLSTVSDPQYCKALANWLNSDSIERKDHAEARPQQSTPRASRPGELDTSSRQEATLKELERKANERLRRLGVSGV